jgi:hypothetical protein
LLDSAAEPLLVLTAEKLVTPTFDVVQIIEALSTKEVCH